MTATIETADLKWTITRQFDNGAYLMEADRLSVGVDAKGRVYWANPEGWDLIVKDVRSEKRNFSEQWHPHMWHHVDHFFHGTAQTA